MHYSIKLWFFCHIKFSIQILFSRLIFSLTWTLIKLSLYIEAQVVEKWGVEKRLSWYIPSWKGRINPLFLNDNKITGWVIKRCLHITDYNKYFISAFLLIISKVYVRMLFLNHPVLRQRSKNNKLVNSKTASKPKQAWLTTYQSEASTNSKIPKISKEAAVNSEGILLY